MSYGKHQSFYLKKHWVNKGIRALTNFDDTIFFDPDGFKRLGIGKNMLQALRFWLETLGIIEVHENDHAHHNLTELGELIRNYDVECTKNLTLNLLHYNVVKGINKKDILDTFDWYFNKYEEQYATKDKIKEDLVRYNKGVTSLKTIDKDIDCLLATYTKNDTSHPEDKNISFLSGLGLIKKTGKYYIKTPIFKDKISFEAFIYIIYELRNSGLDLRLENIVSGENSPGKIFNLSRNEVIDIIENMIRQGYPIDITRTNNLDTVRINITNGVDYLRSKYRQGCR